MWLSKKKFRTLKESMCKKWKNKFIIRNVKINSNSCYTLITEKLIKARGSTILYNIIWKSARRCTLIKKISRGANLN